MALSFPLFEKEDQEIKEGTSLLRDGTPSYVMCFAPLVVDWLPRLLM